MVLKENKRFVKRFAQYEAKESTKSSYSSYSGSSYAQRWEGVPKEFQTTIFFYEWSTMTKGAKTFYDKRAFKTFLEESKIVVDSSCMEKIDNKTYIYCTCKPDESVLMVEDTYFKLQSRLDELKGIKKESPSDRFDRFNDVHGCGWGRDYDGCEWWD